MIIDQLFVVASLLVVAFAWAPPTYSGYSRVWQSTCIGKAGTLPSSTNWNIIAGGVNYNNEIQTYSRSKQNIQLSGSGTLQFIPLRDSSVPGGWTSSRIESKYTFTPQAGRITRVEASIRLAGTLGTKQGIWPAFWMLGNSHRQGKVWPACGEIDVLENINGEALGHGALHCDVYPGGICNEGTGLTSTASLPDTKFHVWRVEFNRKSTNFENQTIAWYKDGYQFMRISGSQIGSSQVWSTLCHSPMFFILNVAVGGYWPGPPNKNTLSGSGSMMEIGYVAHYVSQ
ncbi:Fc.00g056780.m01.CDS01 [Cosmosporella sp. VM-42]